MYYEMKNIQKKVLIKTALNREICIFTNVKNANGNAVYYYMVSCY